MRSLCLHHSFRAAGCCCSVEVYLRGSGLPCTRSFLTPLRIRSICLVRGRAARTCFIWPASSSLGSALTSDGSSGREASIKEWQFRKGNEGSNKGGHDLVRLLVPGDCKPDAYQLTCGLFPSLFTSRHQYLHRYTSSAYTHRMFEGTSCLFLSVHIIHVLLLNLALAQALPFPFCFTV